MENNKKKQRKPVFVDNNQYDINYGTISEYDYEPPYEEGELRWPTEHPKETPKPDVCSKCNEPEYLVWAYNPEIVVKEKKFKCEWMCFKCFRILYNENNEDKF